ncbi:hypothetical protein ACH42_07010 [Endozoicomonas sp. (ex Bugula neritina AB1)]|nr:hypothetical protein ACH42_07010 [Endozoicomonas sp. (ex Bugula neritina AB1)]
MNNNLVVKHNDLIEASYKLTLEEQRLILASISKVDSRKDVPVEIMITAKEYAELFDLQLKHSYFQLKEATNNLYERDIQIKGKKQTERMRWVYKVAYSDGEGYVTLKFSPEIKLYLSQLNGMFTSYQIANIAKLKSLYSIRMYELLNQWKITGKRVIPLGEFRRILELEDSYPRFADLKRRVIQPAVDELNKQTDIAVSFDVEKQGRAVSTLLFSFSAKPVQLEA